MNKEKVLKIIIKSLLIVSVFIPLVFYKEFFYPFVTGKVLVFRLLVELGFVLLIGYFFVKKKIAFPKNLIGAGLLCLTAVILLAGFFGVDAYNSFWSNMERAEGGLFWIHLLVYFFLVLTVFTKKEDYRLLFRVSLFVCLAVIVYGFAQSFSWFGIINTTGTRMSSTVGNAAYLGSYVLINIFLALYLFVNDKNIFWRMFYVPVAIIGAMAVFLTQTRGAILGLIGGLILVALLSVFQRHNKQIRTVATGAIIAMTLAVLAIFIFQNSPVIQRVDTLRKITTTTLTGDTVQTRLVAWRAAWLGFLDRPILGWGPENYNVAFSKYFPPEIYEDSGSQLWFDKAHNVFFEYLVTTGVLGVTAYFGLLLLAVFYLFKNKNLSFLERNLLVGLLAGYAFANLFVFDTVSTYLLLAVILAFIARTSSADKDPLTLKWNYPVIVGLVIVAVIFIFTGFNANYAAIISNKKLAIAEALSYVGRYDEAYQQFQVVATDNNNLTKSEVRRQVGLFVLGNFASFPDYKQPAMFDLAIAETQKSVDEAPDDIRNYYNLVNLYLKSYQFDQSRLDKVIALADKLIALGETRAHTYYYIGEAYYRKGDMEKSLVAYKKSVELNPGVVEGWTNLYVIAVMTGDTASEQAVESAIKGLKPDFFEQENILLRFIPMFKQVGRNQRVIDDLKKIIILKPADIKYQFTLALIYAEMGDNSEAEKIFQSLLGKDATLDMQVAEYIQKLHNGELLKK